MGMLLEPTGASCWDLYSKVKDAGPLVQCECKLPCLPSWSLSMSEHDVPNACGLSRSLYLRLFLVYFVLMSATYAAGITNFVSMDLMANLLLAAGASPAMVRLVAAQLSCDLFLFL